MSEILRPEGYGFYIVYATPAGGMAFVHCVVPEPISHLGHIQAIAQQIAQDIKQQAVLILSWQPLDPAPIITKLT